MHSLSLSLSHYSILVFTGGEDPSPQGIMSLHPDTTSAEITFFVISRAVPLIINFNRQTQPLIHTLPIKVSTYIIHSHSFYLGWPLLPYLAPWRPAFSIHSLPLFLTLPPSLPLSIYYPLSVSRAHSLSLSSFTFQKHILLFYPPLILPPASSNIEEKSVSNDDNVVEMICESDSGSNSNSQSGSGSRIDDELTESIEPLSRMDLIVTNVADRYRGRSVLYTLIPSAFCFFCHRFCPVLPSSILCCLLLSCRLISTQSLLSCYPTVPPFLFNSPSSFLWIQSFFSLFFSFFKVDFY